MDELDRTIVRSLQQEGRLPFTEIARQTGMSETTIRTRYQKLARQGIVRTVAFIEPQALDHEATAILAVSVEHGQSHCPDNGPSIGGEASGSHFGHLLSDFGICCQVGLFGRPN